LCRVCWMPFIYTPNWAPLPGFDDGLEVSPPRLHGRAGNLGLAGKAGLRDVGGLDCERVPCVDQTGQRLLGLLFGSVLRRDLLPFADGLQPIDDMDQRLPDDALLEPGGIECAG